MIIEAKGLGKRFWGKTAVAGLDLSVPEGAAMALIGPNGAGKTTTIRLLMNLLAPTAGEATVVGVPSRKLSHRQFQKIGYVSENQKLPKRLKVDHFFQYLQTLYERWDTDLETRLRRQLDVPGDRRIGQLSHGMRMKTALAAALPFHPDLLVLDEPLSGLDPLVRDEVMSGVLSQAGDMTVLISSHELAEIEGAATHVAFMDKGRVLFQEATEDLLGRFRQVTVTLGERGAPPKSPPASWCNCQSLGPVFAFVATRFAGDTALGRVVREQMGEVAHIHAQPMPLKEVSKAMMREVRQEQPA